MLQDAKIRKFEFEVKVSSLFDYMSIIQINKKLFSRRGQIF